MLIPLFQIRCLGVVLSKLIKLLNVCKLTGLNWLCRSPGMRKLLNILPEVNTGAPDALLLAVKIFTINHLQQ
jgi:hypothetical protein